MTSKSRSNPSGITSIDVARLIGQIEEEHYGNVVVELRLVPSSLRGNFKRFVVVVANYVGTHRTARNTRAASQRHWPNSTHKTLNGCIFNLLHDLYGELEELRAQARGRQPEEQHTLDLGV